jgi:peptidyl-prolyl cis-trans isomerase SurA
MSLRVVTLFSTILSFLLISCAPKHSEVVLAEFGESKITMEEFENVYAKNAGGIDKVKEDSVHNTQKLESFLDLYVNFKMKLRDAQVRGYASNKELNDELLDYKKKIGVTFLLEKQVVEPGIKKLYDRRKTELRVSHLMIRPDTTGDAAAASLAQQLLDSIKSGSNFEQMVEKHTHDVYSRSTGGDIFYVTAGMLPAEFEDACYNTPEGEVYPEVIKTNFGYHIIKVTDKKERIPEIKASHILVDFYDEQGNVDSAAAKSRVDSVVMRIKAGEDFAKLAEEYSEDTGSKAQGGDLGFFQRRMMVKEFDEAAFNLKPGEVSDIVKTNYGYHIIKVTDVKPYPSFEQNKDELKNLYKQLSYNADLAEFVDGLKNKYAYKLNEGSVETAAAKTDTLKVNEKIGEAVNGIKDEPLFSYAGKNVTTGELLDKAVQSTDYANKQADRSFYYEAVNKIAADMLMEEEALNLDKSNAEFAALMEDYRNGLYIFKIQDDEIWSKVKSDSVRLVQYYEQNKDKYTWPDRVSISEIYSRKDSLANHYYQMLQQGADFEEMAEKFTERPGFKDKKGNYGFVDPKTNNLAEKVTGLNPGEYTAPVPVSGGFSIIKLNAKDPARLKTFEEAKAEVSGAFQEAESRRIEQEYLENLKKRYKPEIHYGKLEQAFRSEE